MLKAKKAPSWAAWAKTGSISSDWVQQKPSDSGGGTSGRGTVFCYSGPGLNPSGAPGSNIVFSDVVNLSSKAVRYF